MAKWNILVVDDEPHLLNIIEECLSNDEFSIETTTDAATAWEKLNNPESLFNIIILDRMMPGKFDGLELLRRIKAARHLKKTPVIMQTGASSPEQITEGIEAGAFYYLTKPYAMKSLECIVRAVIADIELRREVSAQADKFSNSLKQFTYGELKFTTLDEANLVAGILAALCPDPDTASQGLVELLLNAVEHGNLGITYDEKKHLMYTDSWEQEVNLRLALPAYKDRVATATFERKDGSIEFLITDQGCGFDWRKYLNPDPGRVFDPNGRGISMARRFSFSSVEYMGVGNIVRATLSL
jgi:DNA-binding response OmpR family regulator